LLHAWLGLPPGVPSPVATLHCKNAGRWPPAVHWHTIFPDGVMKNPTVSGDRDPAVDSFATEALVVEPPRRWLFTT
jgi:hypothetical protein